MSYESYIRLELLKNDLNGRKLVKLGEVGMRLGVRIHTKGDVIYFSVSTEKYFP